MKLTDSLKPLVMDTAAELTGAARRLVMAKRVKQLGNGGQLPAAPELGWNRGTIRQGLQELESGRTGRDNYTARGRQPGETHLPEWLAARQARVDGQSQVAPQVKSPRWDVRLRVRESRHQLMAQKGSLDQELPCHETLRRKLNQLGSHRRRVKQTKPPKKISETEAIFKQLLNRNHEADANPKTLRISVDAKATVTLGRFDRGGKTRVLTAAGDPELVTETVTPYGIFLPPSDELLIYLVSTKLTRECMIDIRQDWWQPRRMRMPHLQPLVINQDNGPANNSSRTQFRKRLVDFAQAPHLEG